LFGKNGMRGIHFNSHTPKSTRQYIYQQLMNGVVVDALLDATPNITKYIMTVPGEDGLYRVDHSGSMGMHPLGYNRKGSSTFYDPSVIRRTILPSLARLFQQYLQGMNTSYTDSAKLGTNILNQIANVVSKFDMERERIVRAISHATNKEQIEKSLADRVEVLRKMISLYANHPNTLVSDLASAGRMPIQKELYRSQTPAVRTNALSNQWDTRRIRPKDVEKKNILN
jgi:hypothetical protein